jgi:hypothetical protein
VILFNLWTVPRSSYIVFELVGVDENQWTQERYEHYQWEVKESKQWVHFENGVDQAKGHHYGSGIVPKSQLVLHQMSENWDKSKNAEGNVEQCENFWSSVESWAQQNGSEKDCIDAGWGSKQSRVVLSWLRGSWLRLGSGRLLLGLVDVHKSWLRTLSRLVIV